MTPRELIARANKAREFTHMVDGVQLTVRLPAPLDMRTTLRANGYATDPVLRALLPVAIIGWKGMTQAHLLAGLTAEEKADVTPEELAQQVEFDPDLVLPFFGERTEQFDVLATEFLKRYGDRAKALETTLGN